jgi:hypothetical protein
MHNYTDSLLYKYILYKTMYFIINLYIFFSKLKEKEREKERKKDNEINDNNHNNKL